MKRFLCFVLTLAVVLGICGIANAAPSKTTGDTIIIICEDIQIQIIVPTAEDEGVQIKETAAEELEKLASCESMDAYFGDALAKAKELLGAEELRCYEFVPIIVSYDNRDDKTTDVYVTAAFATPYAPGESLVVLVGIPGADGTVEWTACEASVNEDGRVAFTMDAATVLAMEASDGVLMAVISK